MLMLIPVFWCPTYMSSWCQSYIQKPSSRSSFLATEDMSWWNIGVSLQVEPLFMSIYNCYLKKKNNFHDLTCAIVHCVCEWAHEDEEWHLTTLLPLLHIICPITLPKLENMTKITAEWDNWISLHQRLQFYRHVLWNLQVTEWQLLFLLYYIYFLYFSSVLYYSYIADWLSVCCFCSVYVQTQAHVRTYTQQPISQLWLLISAQWSQAAGCTEWDITCCCPLLSGCRWLEGWRRTSGPPRSHCK